MYDGVYPRVCGETMTAPGIPAVPEGLSPRVRGNRTLHPSPRQHHTIDTGSIPACAGKPLDPMGVTRSGLHAPVYPRVCGETAPRHDC